MDVGPHRGRDPWLWAHTKAVIHVLCAVIHGNAKDYGSLPAAYEPLPKGYGSQPKRPWITAKNSQLVACKCCQELGQHLLAAAFLGTVSYVRRVSRGGAGEDLQHDRGCGCRQVATRRNDRQHHGNVSRVPLP